MEKENIFNKKVDFILTVEVKDANPNGDPLNGNMPRVDYDDYGEISDVAIKRKIRNRFQDMGKEIFVKSNERIDDDFHSLEERFEERFSKEKFVNKEFENEKKIWDVSCEDWLDVRTFGQVMTFPKPYKGSGKLSIGIRGPVSISLAKSLDVVNTETIQITKSTNGQEPEPGESKSSDTIGSKHFIRYGVYVVKGSINCFFAEKTGFTNDDAETLKEALRTLFVNDASSARPEGSMAVKQLFWLKHNSKLGNLSTTKVYDELLSYESGIQGKCYKDYDIKINGEKAKENGIEVEEIEGL